MTAVLLIGALIPSTASAQHGGPQNPRPLNPTFGHRFTHEFLLPVGSVLIPGLGQWSNGATAAGFGFLGASLTGALVAVAKEDARVSGDRLPRTGDAQLSELGAQLAFDAGLLSGYDSFRRSVRRLQPGGLYSFLETPTPTAQTFIAPFQFGYLKNKKTWIFLLVPLAIVSAVAIDESGTDYLPFKLHDAVYAGATSYGAGVSEEAFFRGYVFPWFNQLSGERWWLANGLQAIGFGLAHIGNVEVPVVQTLGGFYWGWVVKRNNWDIRETIFQHVWWDVIIFTGALLLDDGGDSQLRMSLPEIRF